MAFVPFVDKMFLPCIIITNCKDTITLCCRDERTTLTSLEAPLPILHDSLGLVVSPREAARIERDLQSRLLSQRKLSLVLDLDQTVLHATKDPATEQLLQRKEIINVHRVTFVDCLPGEVYYIKLRPGLEQFLHRMAQLFELHIYTMGSRNYARAVVRLFDPDGTFFYNRILSRDDVIAQHPTIKEPDLTPRKNLKRIFPVDDSTVLIVDDRADVWDYCANLIPVPPCKFNVLIFG